VRNSVSTILFFASDAVNTSVVPMIAVLVRVPQGPILNAPRGSRSGGSDHGREREGQGLW